LTYVVIDTVFNNVFELFKGTHNCIWYCLRYTV